jgi:hypothetical protein
MTVRLNIQSLNPEKEIEMEVWIKTLQVDMQVKQKGLELEVRSADGTSQLGDCFATMTGLIWCKGKTGKGNGVKVKWDDFIQICASDETLNAAVKAAKLEASKA